MPKYEHKVTVDRWNKKEKFQQMPHGKRRREERIVVMEQTLFGSTVPTVLQKS